MSAFNISPQRGFGFQQYINFGKHKGKTYYDVANAGDYLYLKWCLKSNETSVKDPRSFFISDTCMPHIRSALLTENVNNTPWTKQISEEDNNGRCICVYTSKDLKDESKSYEGPDIEMKRCPKCNMIKTYLLFDLGNHNLCRKCYTQENNRMDKQVAEEEFRKGEANSYKPNAMRPQTIRRRMPPVKEFQ